MGHLSRVQGVYHCTICCHCQCGIKYCVQPDVPFFSLLNFQYAMGIGCGMRGGRGGGGGAWWVGGSAWVGGWVR